MGQMMEIIELRGQVERKDAHIDKLQLELDIATKDKSESAELAARLFTENQKLKKQLNDKQLEVEHCHVVCGELRQSLEQMKSLATAGANCAIAAAQDGIEVVKERDALAAQNSKLQRELQSAADWFSAYWPGLNKEQRDRIQQMDRIAKATPASCLAQVKADAIHDTIKVVTNQYTDTESEWTNGANFVVAKMAREAERIRQEVE